MISWEHENHAHYERLQTSHFGYKKPFNDRNRYTFDGDLTRTIDEPAPPEKRLS